MSSLRLSRGKTSSGGRPEYVVKIAHFLFFNNFLRNFQSLSFLCETKGPAHAQRGDRNSWVGSVAHAIQLGHAVVKHGEHLLAAVPRLARCPGNGGRQQQTAAHFQEFSHVASFPRLRYRPWD